MDGDLALRARLDRIDALDDAGAPVGCLLAELQALAAMARAWVDDEAAAWGGVEAAGRGAAARAAARLRASMDGGPPAM